MLRAPLRCHLLARPLCHDEEDNAKETRVFLNRLAMTAHNSEVSDRKRDLKQLDHDSQVYRGIIYDSLVVTAIRDELQDFERSHCSAMTNIAKVKAIWAHLESTHGPHSSVDMQELRQKLTTDLDPTKLGWSDYLRQFNHTVNLLQTLVLHMATTKLNKSLS